MFFVKYIPQLALIYFSIVACQVKPQKPLVLHPATPKNYTPAKAQQLTFIGRNRYPSLSKNNKKMLFVSSLRAKHKHQQVYLKNLEPNHERRITFQDGNVINPQFIWGTNSIIYESTTDEGKDLSQIFKKTKINEKNKIALLNYSLNSEIYLSDLSGHKINRLTHSENFDGFAHAISSKEIIYSSLLKNKFELLWLKKKKNHWHHSKLNSLKTNRLQPQAYLPTKSLVWVGLSKKKKSSTLVLGDFSGKPVQTIEAGGNFSISPKWHPSGEYILFSSNQKNSKNYELYVYELSSKCIKRLTYLSTTEIDPAFSPDGGYVYFSSNLEGSYQIFRMKFSPPISCPNEPVAARI